MTHVLNNTLALVAAAFITATLFAPTFESAPTTPVIIASIA